jgi:hypothetical protein
MPPPTEPDPDEADGEMRPFVMMTLPDTPDSRLFVEMSSYASDLVEARHALTLALRGLTDDSLLAEATQHLVGLAAIAYCRTAMHSNVRGLLSDHIQLPEHCTEIHDRIRIYRNATVAHSQSELAVTYAIGVFDTDTLEARDVTAATVLVPIPDHLIHEFLALVESAEQLLDQAIEPARERLVNSLAEMDRAEIGGLAGPEILDECALDFDPKTKRARTQPGTPSTGSAKVATVDSLR